jgi:hypothetical protein
MVNLFIELSQSTRVLTLKRVEVTSTKLTWYYALMTQGELFHHPICVSLYAAYQMNFIECTYARLYTSVEGIRREENRNTSV